MAFTTVSQRDAHDHGVGREYRFRAVRKTLFARITDIGREYCEQHPPEKLWDPLEEARAAAGVRR